MADVNKFRHLTRHLPDSEMTDPQRAYANLQASDLADGVIRQAGRSASPEFLRRIAATINEKANKGGSQ